MTTLPPTSDWGVCGDVIGHAALVEASAAGTVAVVDVREPEEFAGGHMPGALNVPLSAFDLTRLPQGRPLVLYCRSGARSARALRLAREGGVKRVAHYAGGMLGWQAAGGPSAQ